MNTATDFVRVAMNHLAYRCGGPVVRSLKLPEAALAGLWRQKNCIAAAANKNERTPTKHRQSSHGAFVTKHPLTPAWKEPEPLTKRIHWIRMSRRDHSPMLHYTLKMTLATTQIQFSIPCLSSDRSGPRAIVPAFFATACSNF
jgi:hypothetical protein